MSRAGSIIFHTGYLFIYSSCHQHVPGQKWAKSNFSCELNQFLIDTVILKVIVEMLQYKSFAVASFCSVKQLQLKDLSLPPADITITSDKLQTLKIKTGTQEQIYFIAFEFIFILFEIKCFKVENSTAVRTDIWRLQQLWSFIDVNTGLIAGLDIKQYDGLMIISVLSALQCVD